jgi:hypothetical protein
MLKYLKDQLSALFSKISKMFNKLYAYFFAANSADIYANNTATTITTYIEPQSGSRLSNNHISSQTRLLNINADLSGKAAFQKLREFVMGTKTDMLMHTLKLTGTRKPLIFRALEQVKFVEPSLSEQVKALRWPTPALNWILTGDQSYPSAKNIKKLGI